MNFKKVFLKYEFSGTKFVWYNTGPTHGSAAGSTEQGPQFSGAHSFQQEVY
jgi:hypothetical protein